MGRKKKSVALADSFGTDSAKFAALLVKETADAIQSFKNGKMERADANTIFKGVNTVCNVAKTQVSIMKASQNK